MTRWVALPLLLAVSLTAACGSRSTGREATIEDLAAVVAPEGELDDDLRRCVATALVDDLGVDAARDLVDAVDQRYTPSATRIALVAAYDGCGALEPLLP